MKNWKMILVASAASAMFLAGCSAQLSPADKELLNQALASGQTATQAAQQATDAATRADSAASTAEAAARTAAHRHAARLSRRQLLLDQDAASGLADGDAVQSRRLPDLGLPVELLRTGRRQCRAEPRDDAGLPVRRAGDCVVDIPDGLPSAHLSESGVPDLIPALARTRRRPSARVFGPVRMSLSSISRHGSGDRAAAHCRVAPTPFRPYIARHDIAPAHSVHRIVRARGRSCARAFASSRPYRRPPGSLRGASGGR